MITIPWDKITIKNTTHSITADIGDIRINLTDTGNYWTLSFAFMVYTKTGKRMMRPYDTITHFEKPCNMDEAKHKTEIYLSNFFDTIKEALSNDEQKSELLRRSLYLFACLFSYN